MVSRIMIAKGDLEVYDLEGDNGDHADHDEL